MLWFPKPCSLDSVVNRESVSWGNNCSCSHLLTQHAKPPISLWCDKLAGGPVARWLRELCGGCPSTLPLVLQVSGLQQRWVPPVGLCGPGGPGRSVPCHSQVVRVKYKEKQDCTGQQALSLNLPFSTASATAYFQKLYWNGKYSNGSLVACCEDWLQQVATRMETSWDVR